MLCQIEKLIIEEIQEVKSLLKGDGLPYEDIDEHAKTFLTAKVGEDLIGAIGLEISGDKALLRSLVVKEKYRNYGFGKELYEKCIEMAKQNSINTVALITTTAERFFEKKGFIRVTGRAVPAFIKQTKEFQIYCPSSSTIMMKIIEGAL